MNNIEQLSKYADVNIIFEDARDKIEMKLHRVFLAWKIPYFDKLFSFCDNLQKREFTIQVENSQVASLFLRSLYGEKITWSARQKLLLFLLQSFFCLQVSGEEVRKFDLTPENFDLYLRVVNLPEVELDWETIRKIQDNAPPEYNWEGVDKDFRRMVVKQKRVVILYSISGIVEVIDLEREERKVIHRYRGDSYSFYDKIFLTKDPEVIMLTGCHDSVMINPIYPYYIFLMNIENGEIIQTFDDKFNFSKAMVMMNDKERLIVSCRDNTIQMWNIFNKQHLTTYSAFEGEIRSISLSKDEREIFVTTCSDGYIRDRFSMNVATGNYIKSYRSRKGFYSVAEEEDKDVYDKKTKKSIEFIHDEIYKSDVEGIDDTIITPDNKYMITLVIDDRSINVWSLKTREIVRTLSHDRDIIFICLMHDKRHLISCCYERVLKIWDIFSGKCVKTIQLSPLLEEDDDPENFEQGFPSKILLLDE